MDLARLLNNNRAWAREKVAQDPSFFEELSRGQSPAYLWIGCSDSRVPAEDVVGVGAGELFVHRNIANVVEPSDVSCLSVLQFAVDVLQVKHVIVCGHYGCGGVQAALGSEPLGIIDAWLARIREVARLHAPALDRLEGEDRARRLCELNVLEQARSACYAPSVQGAWRRGQPLAVHGLIYGLEDGLLHDLGFTARSADGVEETFRAALEGLEA